MINACCCLCVSLSSLHETNRWNKVLTGVYGFPPNPKADFVSQSGVQVFVKKTLSDLEGAEKFSLWVLLGCLCEERKNHRKLPI